jgi:hypothetical protein
VLDVVATVAVGELVVVEVVVGVDVVDDVVVVG